MHRPIHTTRSALRHTGRRGFTLLETLLSLALMAVLLAGIWQVMSLYEQVFTQGHTRIESVQVVRSIHEQIAGDLRNAIPDVSDELTGATTVRRFGLFGTSTSLQIDLIEVVPTQFVFDTSMNSDPYTEALSSVGGDSTGLLSGSGGSLSGDGTGGGFGLDSSGGLLDAQSDQSIARRVPELSTVRWQFFDWVDFEEGEGLTLIDLLAINSGLEPINTPTGESDAFTSGFLVTDEESATDETSDLFGEGGSRSGSSGSTSLTSTATSGGVSDLESGTAGGTTRFRFNQSFAAASQSGSGAILIGLVRRQIDWETPLDPASSESNTTSTTASQVSGTSTGTSSASATTTSTSSTGTTSADTTTSTSSTTGNTTTEDAELSDTLSGLSDTTVTTGSDGSGGMPTSALQQQRIRTLFHPEDPNVTWFPEVIGAEFQYYDGSSWTSEWNSLTRRSLPVAVVLRIQVLPRRSISARDAGRIRGAIASGDTNVTILDGMVVGEVDDDTGEYAVGEDYTGVIMGTTGVMSSGGGTSSGSVGSTTTSSISSGSGTSSGSGVSSVSGGGLSGSQVSGGSGSSTGSLSGRPIIRGSKYYQFLMPLPSTAIARNATVSQSDSGESELGTLELPETELPDQLELPTVTLPTTEGDQSSTTSGSDQWMRTQ
ncbi:MAG: prepilin-type N-terminal cleavage/methylation domain-containing protein [Planctomycetia bacterium]|nr:prepilin-type N-terminal cleavage/methylation domain-containing protein [Planctomycetia bacterium]